MIFLTVANRIVDFEAQSLNTDNELIKKVLVVIRVGSDTFADERL